MPAAAAPPPFVVDDRLTPALDALRAVLDAPAEERGKVLSGINEEDLDAIIAAAQRMKSRARSKAAADDDDEPDDESSQEGAGESVAPAPSLPLPPPARITAAEAGATLGAWLEARLHSHFTLTADELYGGGMLSREERQALSGALSTALDAFVGTLQSSFPDAFSRSPYAGPEADDAVAVASSKEARSIAAFERVLFEVIDDFPAAAFQGGCRICGYGDRPVTGACVFCEAAS